MSEKIPRDEGLVDSSPASDVQCSYIVGWPSEVTPETRKQISGRSVSPLVMPTFRAGVRCPSGVHGKDGNACQSCFIFDEASELLERPRVVAATLRSPYNRYPSDALKLLKGDHPLGVFSLRHQPLRDHMVDVTPEPRLPAGKLLEMASSALCSYHLEFRFQSLSFNSDLIHLFPAVYFPIGVYGQILQAEVYSKSSYRVESARLRGVYDHSQIERAPTVDKVGLPSDAVEARALVFPYSDGYSHPPVQGQDRGFIESPPGEDALIVDHRSVGSKLWFDVFVPLVGFHDFADRPYSHLGGEPEPLPNGVVDDLLEGDLIRHPLLVGYGCDEVAGVVELAHRLKQTSLLFAGRIEFDHEGLLHSHIDGTLQYKDSRIPPTPKGRGLPAGDGDFELFLLLFM